MPFSVLDADLQVLPSAIKYISGKVRVVMCLCSFSLPAAVQHLQNSFF